MHAQYDEAHRQEVCCAPLPAADIRSSSRGSSQRPAGDPRRSPVPGNGGLWRRSVGSISRVERRGEAAEHRRSDCPEEVARMQPRVPPTMAAEQAGVSKIGSWWRLALGPPGGEGGVAVGWHRYLSALFRFLSNQKSEPALYGFFPIYTGLLFLGCCCCSIPNM